MPRGYFQILILLLPPFASVLGQANDSLTAVTFLADTLAIVRHLQPSPSDSIYDADKCDSLPHPDLNTYKMPDYPAEEKKAGIEGSVWFELIISPQGIPVKAKLIQSAHKAFTRISLEAIMKVRYSPAMKSGKAVYCRLNSPVGFRLRKNH